MSRKMKLMMKLALGLLFGAIALIGGCVACLLFTPSEAPPHVTPTPKSLNLPGVKEIEPPGFPDFRIGDWSPDSRSLAITYLNFPVESGWDSRIYILDVATGEKKLIEETRRGGRAVVDWLPTHQIAFWAITDMQEGIWLMNEDGSGERQYVTKSNVAEWSPDGKQVAYVDSYHDDETNVWIRTIRLIETDRGIDRMIYEVRGMSLGALFWSPDGHKLVFGAGAHLYTMNVESGEIAQLTHEGDNNGAPSWSPNGQMIAYNGDYQLVIMRSDGTCPIWPLPEGTRIYAVSWSPDGRWIAFGWNEGIYLLDIEAVLGKDFLEKGPTCP